jgi:exo-beta-1,3-glucanase (GH17 family)
MIIISSCTSNNQAAHENPSNGNLDSSSTTKKVEIKKENGNYQLYRNNAPYQIRGAGLQIQFLDSLVAHGGNSLRTWGTENASEILDKALEKGLTVSMGIWVAPERHHFDYDDLAAVEKQFKKIKKDIIKYKDHPALLNWVIGNELNHEFENPKVYDAVNEISKMIHEVDPNHLTTTTTAGINKKLADIIKIRAPDLDFLSIQVYAAIDNLPRDIKKSGWTGPYMVTEWGATGHWEVALTEWGAPIEQNSTIKAANYLERYNTKIAPYKNQCIGYYVFLWGQKQERTPTWYGMFLEDGSSTECVDVMHYIWNKDWPKNRTPKFDSLLLAGNNAYNSIRLTADQSYPATAFVTDYDQDPLTYNWEIKSESDANQEGGDAEEIPETIPNKIDNPKSKDINVTAPTKSGAYRLFVYAYDGKGHVAHANIPFYVN